MLFKKNKVYSVVSRAISVLLVHAIIVSNPAFAFPQTDTLAPPTPFKPITKKVRGIRTVIPFNMSNEGLKFPGAERIIPGERCDKFLKTFAQNSYCGPIVRDLANITLAADFQDSFLAELAKNSYDSFLDKIEEENLNPADFVGRITIEAYYEGNDFVFNFIDNGKTVEFNKDGSLKIREGFPFHFRKKHTAMKALKNAVISLGGAIRWQPLKDGTRVQIRLPGRRARFIKEGDYINIEYDGDQIDWEQENIRSVRTGETTGAHFKNRVAFPAICHVIAKYFGELSDAGMRDEIRRYVGSAELNLLETHPHLDPILGGARIDELTYDKTEETYRLPIYRNGAKVCDYVFYRDEKSRDDDNWEMVQLKDGRSLYVGVKPILRCPEIKEFNFNFPFTLYSSHLVQSDDIDGIRSRINRLHYSSVRKPEELERTVDRVKTLGCIVEAIKRYFAEHYTEYEITNISVLGGYLWNEGTNDIDFNIAVKDSASQFVRIEGEEILKFIPADSPLAQKNITQLDFTVIGEDNFTQGILHQDPHKKKKLKKPHSGTNVARANLYSRNVVLWGHDFAEPPHHLYNVLIGVNSLLINAYERIMGTYRKPETELKRYTTALKRILVAGVRINYILDKKNIGHKHIERIDIKSIERLIDEIENLTTAEQKNSVTKVYNEVRAMYELTGTQLVDNWTGQAIRLPVGGVRVPSSGIKRVILNDEEVGVEQLNEEMQKFSKGQFFYASDLYEDDGIRLEIKVVPFGTRHHSINYHSSMCKGHIFDDKIELTVKHTPLKPIGDTEQWGHLYMEKQKRDYRLRVIMARFFVEAGFRPSFGLRTLLMKDDLDKLQEVGLLKTIPQTLEEFANQPLLAETQAINILSKPSVEEERARATRFQDKVKVMQVKRKKASLIVALGTSWMKGYERYSDSGNDSDKRFRWLQGQPLNELITAISGSYEPGDNVEFIYDEDDALLERITEVEGHEKAKIVILAGEDTITSAEFKPLVNRKNTFAAGVNNENLTMDSYIRLIEMLNLTLEFASGKPIYIHNPYIDIEPISDTHGKILYYIFIPRAEPMDYEDLRDIYGAQAERFA
jgi:hypothetical protein